MSATLTQEQRRALKLFVGGAQLAISNVARDANMNTGHAAKALRGLKDAGLIEPTGINGAYRLVAKSG